MLAMVEQLGALLSVPAQFAARPDGTRAGWMSYWAANGFFGHYQKQGVHHMRGVLLWLVGIPIPIIILLYLFGVM